MSILSTNNKLIKVGQDYSAGDNISIYQQGEQLYISSKDWTNDIANASANAYNEAVAKIPDPFDPTFISAKVDNKLDTTAFTNWQNGQYSTDLQTIEGQITNKLDATAFSNVSGNFLTAAPADMATTGYVAELAQTISETYQTKGDYATVEYVDSATSGLYSHTVEYYNKPSAGAIEANENTLSNVGQIVNNSLEFYIVPSSILQVPKIITLNTENMFTHIITATKSYGFCFSGNNSNFSANRYGLTNSASDSYFSAGRYGLYNKYENGNNIFISDNEGLKLSSNNTYFSAGVNGIYNLGGEPSLLLYGAGCKIDINVTGGSAVDSNGIKKWQIGEVNHLWSFAGSDYTERPIVLCYTPQNGSAYSPYFIAGPGGITSEFKQNNETYGLYGNFGNGIRLITTRDKVTATLNYNDVGYTKYNDSLSANDVWSLTGSVQKREIEYDAATSAITAIAGSAIGGGGTGGDPKVNSFVYDNSATINEVNTTYQSNSSNYITAHQSLSNYVSRYDTSVTIGFQNTASDSFSQGEFCNAKNWSFAQGSNNSANDQFLARFKKQSN